MHKTPPREPPVFCIAEKNPKCRKTPNSKDIFEVLCKRFFVQKTHLSQNPELRTRPEQGLIFFREATIGSRRVGAIFGSA